MDALVPDAHIRTAVAGLRALGASGLDVLALGPGWSAAGLWSRHAAARAVGPEAVADPGGFAATVGRLATEHGRLVVYPAREETLDALLEASTSLPPEAILPYPRPEAVRALRDKGGLAARAEAAGLAAPATVVEATAGELALAPFPGRCVVKPARPGGPLASARVVESEEKLRALVRGLPADEPLLVQDRARGPLVGLALVVDREGGLVARFQQVARRTWPPLAGGSSLAVSVEPDDRLAAAGARMLAESGHWGLAQLQFVDTVSGPALIDVNTRLYGTLPLALACGVNLPAAWHAVAVGAPPPVAAPYPAGVGYRWLEADLSAAARGSPGLLLSRAPRPRTGAMWALDDPLPGVLLAAAAVAVRARRRLPGSGPPRVRRG